MHDIDDVGNVLVRVRHLLGDRALAAGLNFHAAVAQFLDHVLSLARLLGFLSAHVPSRTVTGASKRLPHGAVRADGEIGVSPHVARNEDGLADAAVGLGDVFAARTEGARGALAVHAHAPLFAVYFVCLELGDVVADIIDRANARLTGGNVERLHHGLLGEVHDDLPVREGVIRRAAHGAEIRLSLSAGDRRAGELPVRDGDVVFFRRLLGDLQIIVADLVPESPRPAVDQDDDAVGFQPEHARGIGMENLVDASDFKEMIARSQRAQLVGPALPGTFVHCGRVGIRNAAVLFDEVELCGRPETVLRGPARALDGDVFQIPAAQLRDRFRGSDTGRNIVEKLLDELTDAGFDVVGVQLRRQQANTAVDVVADATGRDDAVFGVGGTDAADGESIPPVDVGHGEGILHDAGEMRHISDLLQTFILLDAFHHCRAGVYASGYLHAAGFRDLPGIVVELSCLYVHDRIRISYDKSLVSFRAGSGIKNHFTGPAILCVFGMESVPGDRLDLGGGPGHVFIHGDGSHACADSLRHAILHMEADRNDAIHRQPVEQFGEPRVQELFRVFRLHGEDVLINAGVPAVHFRSFRDFGEHQLQHSAGGRDEHVLECVAVSADADVRCVVQFFETSGLRHRSSARDVSMLEYTYRAASRGTTRPFTMENIFDLVPAHVGGYFTTIALFAFAWGDTCSLSFRTCVFCRSRSCFRRWSPEHPARAWLYLRAGIPMDHYRTWFSFLTLAGIFLVGTGADAQTTLRWQHPFPQGNMLMSIAAAPDGSFIVTGRAGTVLRSEDDGATWSHTMFGLTDNVISSSVTHADGFWCVADNGILLHSSDGGRYWDDVHSITAQGLNGVARAGAETVIACGDGGTIIRSTDGGKNWEQVFSGVSGILNDIAFVSDRKGFIVGEAGTLLETDDGGATWTSMRITPPQDLFAIAFADASSGWICGTKGSIYHTVNGGFRWDRQQSGSSRHLNDILPISTSEAWAVGDGGTMLHTTNSGAEWRALPVLLPESVIEGVAWNGSVLLAAGEFGHLLRSTDGGAQWTVINGTTRKSANWTSFATAHDGWCFGQDGMILHTTDGGAHWQEETALLGNSLYGGKAVSADAAWTVGEFGVILHTADGGVTWTQQENAFTNILLAVDFATPEVGWAVGELGMILKTTNGGATWGRQESGTQNYLFGVQAVSEQHAVITGDAGLVLASFNGGATWKRQQTPTGATLYWPRFVSDAEGWIVGEVGTILHTTDAGATWNAQDAGTATALYVIDGAHRDALWAIGDGGTVLRSTNAGTDWQPVYARTNYDLFGLDFVDETHGWISGDYATVLTWQDDASTSVGPSAAAASAPLIRALYPNPLPRDAVLSVELHALSDAASLRIYDMLGRLVLDLSDRSAAPAEREATVHLPVSRLTGAGRYFLVAQHDGRVETRMVIIQ